MSIDLAAAREFLFTHARVLERRLFAHRFAEGEPSEREAAAAVERAVDAYRNADGGYGQALEPDCRTPHSQPEAMRWALQVLTDVGRCSAEHASRSADWLASVSTPEGGVPFCLPSVEGFPKAPWWVPAPEPNLNPTARIVALLRPHAAEHPWIESASAWCWSRVEARKQDESGDQYEVHSVVELLLGDPDESRCRPLLDRIGGQLGEGRVVPVDPALPPPRPDTHTPLHFAPAPNHPLRRYFDDSTIDGFLDRLASDQEDDGGWPIDWPAPGETAVHEWRGVKTLEALELLEAYDRL